MSSWTQDDVNRHNAKLGAKMPAHVPAPQKSKYKNVRTTIDGETFDSQREANCWAELKLREKAGEITDVKRQVPFSLMCPTPGDDEEVCRYFADFTYRDVVHGRPMQLHVVDAKGKRTPMYILKKKWLKIQDGVTVEEV